ncbi:MAG: hypothetical protein Kow00124_19680 [Anaerolineae bacterium]
MACRFYPRQSAGPTLPSVPQGKYGFTMNWAGVFISREMLRSPEGFRCLLGASDNASHKPQAGRKKNASPTIR